MGRSDVMWAGQTLKERFFDKLDANGDDECWPWLGATGGPKGYGKFKTPERLVQAHRFAYEVLIGPIPDGLSIDHLCRNPNCVNPFHMEPVTKAENSRRAFQAITHCPRGHEYAGANLYIDRKGGRRCRRCHRERMRRS